MRYTIEVEVSCIRVIEVEAQSEAQAIAAAQDCQLDHMDDRDAHDVVALLDPVGFEGTFDDRIVAKTSKGDPEDYYGYDPVEETE